MHQTAIPISISKIKPRATGRMMTRSLMASEEEEVEVGVPLVVFPLSGSSVSSESVESGLEA